jgi:predicted GIY-YIG superfamily endonuclease
VGGVDMEKLYIYKITTPTNAVYIGLTKNVEARFRQHNRFGSPVFHHVKNNGYKFSDCNIEIVKEGIYKDRTEAQWSESEVIEECAKKEPILNKCSKYSTFNKMFHCSDNNFLKSDITNPKLFVMQNGKYKQIKETK